MIVRMKSSTQGKPSFKINDSLSNSNTSHVSVTICEVDILNEGLSRLQKVTIEDVKDEDSDTTPTSMINDDDDGNKLIRDYSFNSNKSSDKTSTKVKLVNHREEKLRFEIKTLELSLIC